MKLNKKTIYKIETLEAYNNFIDDCIKQGFRHPDLSDLKQWNIWTSYDERTCVRINEHGGLNYCYEEYYTKEHCDEYKDYAFVIYRDTSKNRRFNIDSSLIQTIFDNTFNPFSSKCYTVRVDNNVVTVITPEGKVSKAYCHPDDDFDIVTGFGVALQKLKHKEHPKTTDETRIINTLNAAGCETFYVRRDIILGFSKDTKNIEITKHSNEFDWLETCVEYKLSEF